ncbi:MAG: restriction system protein [Solirubrobacteraceae bacterium]|jgi:hypothetical protein|nr:restriction system protein [Solirubrobacteraceae bacterium]
MSPQVDLDHDVLDFLKSQAEPFVDTPSTVLRRLLDINGKPHVASEPASDTPTPDKPTRERSSKRQTAVRKSSGRTRAPSGTILPEQDYELPLLRALEEAGGEAPYRDVVEAVGRELGDKLKAADFEELASGGVRWHSRLQFVRLRLIERGDMDREAPRGVWRITDTGRQTLTNDESS